MTNIKLPILFRCTKCHRTGFSGQNGRHSCGSGFGAIWKEYP